MRLTRIDKEGLYPPGISLMIPFVRLQTDANTDKGEWKMARKRNAPNYPEPIRPATVEGMLYQPGDQVIMFCPQCDGHARKAYVLTQYSLQSFKDEKGRIRSAYGYLVRVDGEQEATMAFAWQVRSILNKPAHIRRVK